MPLLNTALGAYFGTSRLRRLYKGGVISIPGRINLSNNPSMETAAASFVCRRNLATDPRATSFTLGNSGFGWNTARYFSEGTYTLMTGRTDGPLPGMTTYARKTVTVAGDVGHLGIQNTNANADVAAQTNGAPATAGQVYTISAFIRITGTALPVAGSSYFMRVVFYDAAGNSLGSTDSQLSQCPVAVGQWARPKVTATAPTGTTQMAVLTNVTGLWPAGTVQDTTGLLVEVTPYLLPYMDGVFIPPATWRRTLAGDPRATVYHNNAGFLGWRTSRWAGAGAAAATYTLVTNATDGPLSGITTYARKTWTVAPANLASSGDTGFDHAMSGTSGLPVLPGQVITFSSYVRGSVARNYEMGVQEYNNGTAGARKVGATIFGAPNTWIRLSYTYTVPATGVTHIIAISDSNLSGTGGAVPWTVGSTLDGTALLAEYGASLMPYTDQSYSLTTWPQINVVNNPRLGANTTGYAAGASGGTVTVTRETTAGPFADTSTWYKAVFTATNTASPVSITPSSANDIPVQPGVAYTASAYCISNYTGFGGVRVDVIWYDAAGTEVSRDSTSQGQALLAKADTWERRWKTLTAPAGAVRAYMSVAFSGVGIPVNTYIGATCFLFEPQQNSAGTPSSYYDGNKAPVLRTNLIRDPYMTNSNLVVPTGTFSSGTQTAGTPGQDPFAGSTFRRLTAPASGVSSGSIFDTNGSASFAPVVAAGPVIWSTWVRPSHQVTIRCSFIHGGAGAITTPVQPDVVCPPKVWTRVYYGGTIAPASAGIIGLRTTLVAGGGSLPSGGYIDIGGMLMEQNGTFTPGVFFGGNETTRNGERYAWSSTAFSTPSYAYDASVKGSWPVGSAHNSVSYIVDSDMTPAWTGTALLSASTSSAPGVTGHGTNGNGNASRLQSWAAGPTTAGTSRAVRIIAAATSSPDTFAEVAASNVGGMPVFTAMQGKTYIASALITVRDYQFGVLSPQARRLVVTCVTPGGNVTTQSVQAPLTPGSTRLAVQVTVPADATFITFRGYNGGAPGNPDVWWDDLVIEEAPPAPFTLPAVPSYRDGRTPGWGWHGAVDSSQSSGLN